MGPGLWRIGQQRLTDLDGFVGREDQAGPHQLVIQDCLGSCQDKQPTGKAGALLEGLAYVTKAGATLSIHAGTFSPEPSGSTGPQHAKDCLGDFAVALGVKQVVDRPQSVARYPKSEDLGAALAGPGPGPIGHNFGPGGDESLEFLDLFLQVNRVRSAGRDGQLNETPCRSWIVGEVAVWQ